LTCLPSVPYVGFGYPFYGFSSPKNP
jgi:hypothetical protein